MKKFLLFLIFLLALSTLTIAAALPQNLQNAIQQTLQEAGKISLLIAFLGGIISFLAPCLLPILPAFFAYTFKEKKEITKMTLIFFLGFSLIFILYGLTASFFSGLLNNYKETLTVISGLLLIFLGVLAIIGKGFTFIKIDNKFKHDIMGVFLMGIFFAIGFSPCLGPILGGILIIAANFNSYLSSGLLLFTYSLGIFVPLFTLSFIYDKLKLSNTRFMRDNAVNFNLFSKNINTHTTNIISVMLIILIGIVYVVLKNTSFINNFDIFGTKNLFYVLQRSTIGNNIASTISLILLIALLLLIIKFLFKKK